MKRKWKWWLPMVVVIVLGWWYFRGDGLGAPSGEPTFTGDSTELTQTCIVPTLDTPLPEGKNIIWCASFLAAWKEVAPGVKAAVTGMPEVDEFMATLDAAPDPRPHIDPASLLTAGGWVHNGIIDQIASDFAARFPSRELPDFSEVPDNGYLAFAWLEANVPFTEPYYQNDEPMVFTSGTGQQTELSSFGITREQDWAARHVRQQVKVLHYVEDKNNSGMVHNPDGPRECIVDLDGDSEPNQVLLAMVDKEPSFSALLTKIDECLSANNTPDEFGPNDILLVPDMVWQISHHFGELEQHPLIIAAQDIDFRLDRNGAELRSGARVVFQCGPARYLFNKPFLLVMKKRNAKMPFFVMWVDNAELLTKWKAAPHQEDSPTPIDNNNS